jgi:hypothetical protein
MRLCKVGFTNDRQEGDYVLEEFLVIEFFDSL